MKNKLTLAVSVLAFLMSSCSTDDGPSTPTSQKAIKFSSEVAASTKASINTIYDVKAHGFCLTAVKHTGDWGTLTPEEQTPNFMYNQAILWDTQISAYTYSPVKYWPLNGDKVSFFAYAPKPTELSPYFLSDLETTGRPYLTYTSPSLRTQQVDLLTAKSLNCMAESTGTEDGSVYFDFVHPLSKIGFAAKLKEALPAGVTVTLNTLRFYYASEDTRGLISQAQYFLDNDTWTLSEYTFENTAEGEGEALVSSDVAIASHTAATSLTGAEDYLMFIPQVYNEGAMYVTIDYTIDYNDPNSDYSNQRVVTDYKMVLPAILNVEKQNIGWRAGQSYTYTLEISDVDIETKQIS